MEIISPMARGNGAYIVHSWLAQHIPGYHLIGYDPSRTYFPPTLIPLGRDSWGKRKDILHVTPDYAVFHAGVARHTVLTFHNYVLDHAMRAHASPAQRLHYRTDLRFLTKRAMNIADVVTCVSESTRCLVEEDLGWRGSVKVIMNGVDPSRFQPSSVSNETDRFTVLFSGNMTRRKGFHYLGPLARRLGNSVRIVYTAGLNSRGDVDDETTASLECLGRIEPERMPEVYRQADALLVTSFREGNSLAVLEAMASGLPVVGFSSDSILEQVDNGRGGLFVATGDLDALAESIETLRSDPILRGEMGCYNRKRVLERFTIDRMVLDYTSLFHDLT